MKIEDSSGSTCPIEEAWKVLLDLERIAPCLPGAQLQEIEGDEYRGIVKIKVGPITAQYKGVAKIEEADEANHKVVLKAEGRDTRGQGNASATVTATLVPDGDGTTVQHRHRPQHHRQGRAVRPGRDGRRVEQAARPVRREPRARRAERHAPSRRRGARPTPARCPRPAPASPADAGLASTARGRRRSAQDRLQEAEPIDLMDAAGGSVGKRMVPIIAGLVVRASRSASIFKRRKRQPQQVRHDRRADPSRIEPVFDPAGRRADAGPGHRPRRVALRVRRGASRRARSSGPSPTA